MSLNATAEFKSQEKVEVYLDTPRFSGNNVPIEVAARVMKKDRVYVTQGLRDQRLPFGVAFKRDGSSHFDYYISPKLFWEFTGYVYEGSD